MKIKYREAIGTMAIFAMLIYLGKHSYLLEWLSERYFCFIWIPIFILWIIRKNLLARWLTWGTFGGLLLGQFSEDLKWRLLGMENQAAHSSYWGVGTWLFIVILSLGLGALHTSWNNKKSKRSE